MSDFFTQLCAMQKLGQALRAAHPSWKITYIQESWQGDQWLREICHRCDQGPLVYAQTLVPIETYRTHEAELTALGARSIGDHFLFLHPEMRREPFTCNLITAAHPLHSLLSHHLGPEAVFYKRASVFYLGKNSLTIAEYFGEKALSALGISPP